MYKIQNSTNTLLFSYLKLFILGQNQENSKRVGIVKSLENYRNKYKIPLLGEILLFSYLS